MPGKWLSDNNENEDLVLHEDVTKVILDEKFSIPGGAIKSLQKMTSKDIYNVLLLNRSVDLKSKRYWTAKFNYWNNLQLIEINFEVCC